MFNVIEIRKLHLLINRRQGKKLYCNFCASTICEYNFLSSEYQLARKNFFYAHGTVTSVIRIKRPKIRHSFQQRTLSAESCALQRRRQVPDAVRIVLTRELVCKTLDPRSYFIRSAIFVSCSQQSMNSTTRLDTY